LKIRLNFSGDPTQPSIDEKISFEKIAFTRLPGENHQTITCNGQHNGFALELIQRSLSVSDDSYAAWINELRQMNDNFQLNGEDNLFTHGYQNTVICLKDDYGNFVEDYFLEIFAKQEHNNQEDLALTRRLQEEVLQTTHCYEDNKAFRSILINTTKLFQIVQNRSIYISICAQPEIKKTKTVGYSTLEYDDIGSIKLSNKLQKEIFAPDRTVLIEITIKRQQNESIFTITK
jgi:hypothetical protein